MGVFEIVNRVMERRGAEAELDAALAELGEKLPGMILAVHTQDEDCRGHLDAAGICQMCQTWHGEPCRDCGGRGHHRNDCPVITGREPQYTAGGGTRFKAQPYISCQTCHKPVGSHTEALTGVCWKCRPVPLTALQIAEGLTAAYAVLGNARQALAGGPEALWLKVHHAQLYINAQVAELLSDGL